MKEAEEHNVALDVHIAPHFFPDWALEKMPGLKHNNGLFLQFNVMDPRARAIVEAHLRTFIPLIKDYKSLFSITLDNEPWFIAKRDTATAQAWHTYLQQLYSGDLQRMNQVYGTSYTAFVTVPMPEINASYIHQHREDDQGTAIEYDWIVFCQEQFASWHRWLADVVHSMAPTVPVHVKMQIRGEHVGGVNLERMAFTEINGHDGGMWGGDWMYTQFLDKLGSMRQAAPIFNGEEHMLGGPGWTVTTLWQGAVHGRNASAIWIWDPEIEEAFRVHPEYSLGIGRTALDLNRLAPEMTALRNVPPQAAILTSEPSEFYNLTVPAAQGIAYKALLFRGRPARFITEKQLAAGQLGQEMLLIIPSSTHVYASTLAAVTRFVEAGGRVLAIGKDVLAYDEHRQPLPAQQVQHALATAVGVDDPTVPSIYGDSVALEEFQHTLMPHLEQLLPIRVTVHDPGTHHIVNGVEWRAVSIDGRLVINVANYVTEKKMVNLMVDGRLVENATELISGTKVGQLITLNPRSAYLFEIPDPRGANGPSR